MVRNLSLVFIKIPKKHKRPWRIRVGLSQLIEFDAPPTGLLLVNLDYNSPFFTPQEFDKINFYYRIHLGIFFILAQITGLSIIGGLIAALISSLIWIDFIIRFGFEPFFTTGEYQLYINFILTIFVAIISLIISLKILGGVIEKNFPEEICTRQLIYLMFDLSREDSIFSKNIRRIVIHRLDYLAKITLLIPLGATNSDDSQKWIEDHFRQISMYIAERRRWILAPTGNTLSTLRQDFCNLLDIFLNRRYGDFQWEDTLPAQKKENRVAVVFKQARQILGIILPFTLLYLHLWKPDFYQNLTNLQSKNVTLVLIAWILITIDLNLKLGVVRELINLAKGLRDFR